MTDGRAPGPDHIFDRFESPEEVLARVQEVWNLAGEFPQFHDDALLACPTCRGGTFTYRYWRFFERFPKGTIPHRCDIGVKCNRCGIVLTFGIPIPVEVYDRAPVRAARISRRDALRYVAATPDAPLEDVEADYY